MKSEGEVKNEGEVKSEGEVRKSLLLLSLLASLPPPLLVVPAQASPPLPAFPQGRSLLFSYLTKATQTALRTVPRACAELVLR